MPKIHDWERVYWRNADFSREYPTDDAEREQVKAEYGIDEATCSVHRNARGETVSYHLADDDEAEHKYEVRVNGQVPENVTLDGSHFDEEEFDALVFETRREAREAASDLMRAIEPVDPELLEDEDEGYDYDRLQELAKPRGIKANQSADQLRDALRA